MLLLIRQPQIVAVGLRYPPLPFLTPTRSFVLTVGNPVREWIGYYLEKEIALSPQNIAGESVYFGAKHLMAYAQLCLVASELTRFEIEGKGERERETISYKD